MNDYKEFQFGWLIFALMLPIQVFITYAYLFNLGDKPFEIIGFSTVSIILIFVYLLFYGLTTKISGDTIAITFGIGLINRRIKMERIIAVEAVKNPWYYGWGIRYFPKGMLYTISGSSGVEIKFKDTLDVIRIGTKNSAKLKLEILKRIK